MKAMNGKIVKSISSSLPSQKGKVKVPTIPQDCMKGQTLIKGQETESLERAERRRS